MYKEYFGLTEYPFSLTPDPKFIVPTSSYNELLASLYYGIEMAKGLIVLTGEVGTGKTTALRWTIGCLDVGVLSAYIFNPHLSIEEFYHHLSDVLGIKEWANKSELLTQMGKLLHARHRRGLRTILIVDEAHELSDEVMEEIRLLLNFESDNAKHLQIILTGQPELKNRLRQSNLRQLKQRVAVRCEMPALKTVEAVARYITERLRIGGAANLEIFSPDAVALIFQCSEGIPRQINNLCDNAMIAAYATDSTTVTREIVAEIAENLDMLPSQDEGRTAGDRAENAGLVRVLTPRGRAELINDYETIMKNSNFDPVEMAGSDTEREDG
jgi:general secretion pathway protein A